MNVEIRNILFTIQNVPIKSEILGLQFGGNIHLQYKMFLLNLIFLKLPI